MEFDQVVRKRRMVHEYEQRPVPVELLEDILEKALHAPSAGFSQGLELVVLQDPESVQWFWSTTDDDGQPDGLPSMSESGPPVLVLVFTNPVAYTARYSEADKSDFGLQEAAAWPVPFWFVDAGMASMLILQAAVDRGLGAWFFGVAEGEQEVREELGIPAELRQVGVIGIGYQAADDRPLGSGATRPRRPLADVLHRERW
jgi:nitroreductase